MPQLSRNSMRAKFFRYGPQVGRAVAAIVIVACVLYLAIVYRKPARAHQVEPTTASPPFALPLVDDNEPRLQDVVDDVGEKGDDVIDAGNDVIGDDKTAASKEEEEEKPIVLPDDAVPPFKVDRSGDYFKVPANRRKTLHRQAMAGQYDEIVLGHMGSLNDRRPPPPPPPMYGPDGRPMEILAMGPDSYHPLHTDEYGTLPRDGFMAGPRPRDMPPPPGLAPRHHHPHDGHMPHGGEPFHPSFMPGDNMPAPPPGGDFWGPPPGGDFRGMGYGGMGPNSDAGFPRGDNQVQQRAPLMDFRGEGGPPFIDGPGRQGAPFMPGPGRRGAPFMPGPGRRGAPFMPGPGRRGPPFMDAPGRQPPPPPFLDAPGQQGASFIDPWRSRPTDNRGDASPTKRITTQVLERGYPVRNRAPGELVSDDGFYPTTELPFDPMHMIPGVDINDIVKLQTIMYRILPETEPYMLPYRAPSVDRPVFTTGFDDSHFHEGQEYVRMFQDELRPDYDLVIYDLGLSTDNNKWVQDNCGCKLRPFEFNNYPPHVRDLENFAFKLMILQEMLHEFGFVFWTDTSFRLESDWTKERLEHILTDTRDGLGVSMWSNNLPQSCFVHPGMYEFLEESPDDFVDTSALEGGAILIHNNRWVQQNLFTPWLMCGLHWECIAPEGASRDSCMLDNMGTTDHCCHQYDQAAMSLIMERVFHFNPEYYRPRDRVHFFDRVEERAGFNKKK
ncbi:PREDICTED: uncharacterized protein LOC106806676 [Priapulus caudatus]|uniref:Uncharacterized protein LOC106806676 n=1 Tax=Priapulus caudatus TaxID=37621 RepID=A0ABM1DW52_PRICU|nr:PREDICTED: uncharacterized protein LOC106806676 [Priapulus caudatus]